MPITILEGDSIVFIWLNWSREYAAHIPLYVAIQTAKSNVMMDKREQHTVQPDKATNIKSAIVNT